MKTLFFLIIICIPVFLFSDFNISKVRTNKPLNEANSFSLPPKSKKTISFNKPIKTKKGKKTKNYNYPIPIINSYKDAENKITVLKNQKDAKNDMKDVKDALRKRGELDDARRHIERANSTNEINPDDIDFGEPPSGTPVA